ncbi:MAG: UDP-N-acetylmuramate--L-alanine ligase [Clostridia bacterium]|nr:UDP-N-acetylmuramate--L-alanine ligase [Clostridia bacterium]
MNQTILPGVTSVHFVGIGGSGMSPLAEILHSLGYTITGSDVNESDNVTRMRRLGIPVLLPQRAENIGDCDLVVYTAAVSADNPELVAATENNIPLMERAKLLGALSRCFPRTVAVAGTHGKTTTSSMISQILLQADRDPSVFIGGRLPLIDANGHAGKSDVFVCEACEFKDHYLEMAPAASIILNVDADHLDYFGSLDNVIASFRQFAAKTTGTLIVNAEDANTLKAVEGLTHADIVRYGYSADCEWTAQNVSVVNGAYGCYDLYHSGEKVATITLGVPGEHNVLNSVAAAAAAHLCGATANEIAAGLAAFHGAGRRFEFLGTVNDITIADDYAHHPTEIIATLSAAKAMNYTRVWAIFQPFTYSRTARHLDEFAVALALADEVVVSDIMGSRETNQWNVSAKQITDQIEGALYLATFDEISHFVAKNAKSNDLILTMGGGDVYKCARMIKALLEKQ